ncbi:uncharacterized protein J3D65DRAFT_609645 [Phyllosticta citribraziliensis]|uniref:DUF4189 domain-containing protein n=1 Tax=Phyllosticta citribraziliensis TaxID=989973 RepID=A0ABR1M995_9PEZI
MRNTILFTLLALVVTLVSGVAIPEDFGASLKKEGGNSDYCKGVIGFSKVPIWGKGSPHEQKLKPKDRAKITKDDIAQAVSGCRKGLGKDCKMIICDLAGRTLGNLCGFSSYAPGPNSVNPDANNGDYKFYDPHCFK